MEKKKIFVVEDERIIAMDLAKRLSDMGYQVLGIASSSSEAIENISKLNPDIILMDIVIKGELDGIETASKIKHLNIPLVFLTAYSDQETLDRAKLTEPYGYILKPFKDKEIKSTIEMSLYKSNIENKLKESEELYKFLYNNYPEIYITINKNSIIKSVNKFGSDLLGYDFNELVEKPVNYIVKENSQNLIQQTVDKILKENCKTSEIIELTLMNKNKKEIWVKVKTKLIHKNNEELFILVCEDLTRIKDLEQQLINSQKLESLGILAGGIAHDFNNMLAMVVSNISLAKLKLDEHNEFLDFSEIKDLLESAESNTFKTRELTQQLLTFSKGGKPLKKLSNKISNILENTAKFATTGTNVDFNIKCCEQLWSLKIDEGQIGQVINNIIINSVQAMPEGGKITISAENVDIQTEDMPSLETGKYLKISIIDDGIGIDQNEILKIFDPYYTTKSDGHGLGLSVTYSIVKNHNGHIEVQSTKNVGTEFSIYLPAVGYIQPSNKDENNQSVISGTGKILFMDDEEEIRDIAQKILNNLGYIVVCVNEGNELLRTYNEHKNLNEGFDLVIMDLTIKNGLGGLDTIEQLLRNDPDAKAIVSSGYSNDSLMSQYQKYGFIECISKPFTVTELSTKVSYAINT